METEAGTLNREMAIKDIETNTDNDFGSFRVIDRLVRGWSGSRY
jgi:hypothetical protein